MGRNKRKRKKLPPEEYYNKPEDYYEGEVLEDYTHSKALMRIQEKITKRAVEIIQAKTPSLILDVGSGAGFSSSYLYLNGFNVIGIDLIFDMLNAYDIRELNPINSDMKLLPFRKNTFDHIISISAFQWIINKLSEEERAKVLKKVANDFNLLLKPGGKAIIQFYPLEEEVLKEIGLIFADYGFFKGNFLIDNPDSNVKRKIFLYLEKPL